MNSVFELFAPQFENIVFVARIRLTIGFAGFLTDSAIEHPSSTGCGVLYRDMGVLIIGMSPVSSGEGMGPVLVDPAA